jgi:transcriptional regulator of acetoin/glycerol metabolism
MQRDQDLSVCGRGTRPWALHVHRVLREARWNKKLAAQLLGIHRRTLYRLTKRYGISLKERDSHG